ncbi:TPA: ligand-binding protein SH3 [bacterium]|jgi:uncharacterized membrane protein|nr:ligand-binding protein SH3 [bacterium]
MTQKLKIFLFAMTPIFELRGAIPFGLLKYDLNWFEVYVISVLGNLIPIVFILLFFDPVSKYLSKKFAFMDRFFMYLFERTRKKHKDVIDKHGWWGLATFVAIPLPVTGSWTGSLIAFLTGMSFRKAFSAITVGVMTAGVIVTAVVKAGLEIKKYFGWQTLIVILSFCVFIWLIFKLIKKRQTEN